MQVSDSLAYIYTGETSSNIDIHENDIRLLGEYVIEGLGRVIGSGETGVAQFVE
jgi:hypothetical protein